MKFSVPGLQLNPFEQHVVHQPRDLPPTVGTLNRETLEALVAACDRVGEAGRSELARLVLSPAPGFGKSHLIGRLFTELDDRATLVYLTPFETSTTYWQSILFLTIDELDNPDARDPRAWSPDDPTQLDLFAEAVLRNLVAAAMDRGTISVVQGQLTPATLRSDPTLSIRAGEDPQSTWLRDHFNEELLPLIEREILPLRLRSGGWVRVLFNYLTADPGSDLRRLSLTWLRYEPLDEEGMEQLGLAPAANPRSEPADDVNVGSWTRLRDLCSLAGFFRPFVFCFDQTESYTARPELLLQFGHVVTRMMAELSHQLTIVTANQAIWDSKVVFGMDVAHRDRFSDPELLRGIRRDEAETFIDLRLQPFGVPADTAANFKDSGWLDSIFVGDRKPGVREFIKFCQDRWSGLSAPDIPAPDQTLRELFEAYVADFRANPQWLKYEPDVFRWLVHGPLAAGKELHCKAIKTRTGYVECLWQIADHTKILFGFVREAQHRQWRKIADSAVEWVRQNPGRLAKTVYFRTDELDPIPKRTWIVNGPAIKAALGGALDLVLLTKEEAARLYAARDLQNEALAGNLHGVTAEQVSAFLANELAPWRHRLLRTRSDLPKPAVQSEPLEVDVSRLIDQVKAIVRTHRFLDVTEVAKLSGVAAEVILVHAGKIPEVQKIAHPNMTLLVWRG